MDRKFAQIDEELIILQAQNGCREAFQKLVDLYDKRLLYFVNRMIDDHSEAFDVMQSVWLVVHRKLNSLKEARAFRVWIYRIAHDRSVDFLRKKVRGPVLFEDVDLVSDTVNTEEQSDLFENAELVHFGLQQLSLDHRRVLTLKFLESMSIEEIAEVSGSKPGTIKSRIFYAKQALRNHIEEQINE